MKKLYITLFFLLISISSLAEIASGTCGPKLFWSLSDEYTLTITGEGNMGYWQDYRYTPWYSYNNQIIKLSIGEKVTSIGDYAFYGCSGLTSVNIPNSVTSIGNYAFDRCSGLTSVNIPNSVTSIGRCAFGECEGLTSITIPNSVTSIGEVAFSGCKGLTSITIPNSVTSIEYATFYYCSRLTSITIPNSVTSIGRRAFYNCEGLTSITIPNSVTSIGEEAFEFCSGLISVNIPNSVTTFAGSAFDYCPGLTSVTVDSDNLYYISEDNVIYTKDKSTLVYCMMTKEGHFIIPNSITSIGEYAFHNCSGLTSITIPNSVTTIGKWAFAGCDGLTSITIPNSVTTIGEWAFAGCDGLTSITIPNSVTTIGDEAFSYCSGLTSITIPNSVTTIGASAFERCNNISTLYWNSAVPISIPTTELRELYIGDNVETLYKPNYTGSLQKVVLGKNVKYIRSETFKGNRSLKELYITGTEVPYLYPNVFTDANLSNATLYVPSEKTAYYKTTEPWNQFGKILDLEGNEPAVTKKCAKPSIAYEDGHLYFSTATPEAEINHTITCSDIKSSTGIDVALSATYNITAFAKKSEYDNSDIATATLVWATATFTPGENTPTSAKSIYVDSTPLLITQSEGILTVSGLQDGDVISAYSTDGKNVVTSKAIGNAALLNLSELQGKVAVLNVAGKSAKVLVK